MRYRAEATTLAGFVQQIACCLLRHGYWFYVTGMIPPRKDARTVDAKLIAKYGIAVSESSRARRKRAGVANLQYLRFDRFFVILATHGKQRFFIDEAAVIRDMRRTPLRIGGYSISYRPGGRRHDGSQDDERHAHVAIDRRRYLDLRAQLLELATRRSVDDLARVFHGLPYEPYAPIRRQYLRLLRDVNAQRKTAAMPPIPVEALRLRRRVVRPFALPIEQAGDSPDKNGEPTSRIENSNRSVA